MCGYTRVLPVADMSLSWDFVTSALHRNTVLACAGSCWRACSFFGSRSNLSEAAISNGSGHTDVRSVCAQVLPSSAAVRTSKDPPENLAVAVVVARRRRKDEVS